MGETPTSIENVSGIKPCDMNRRMKTMLIKPCDKIAKKRRVEQTDVEEFPTIKIEEGQLVDIGALLSSKARDYLVSPKDGKIVPISSLVDKYVLVCGFYVPFEVDNLEAKTCQSLRALYSHLSQQGIGDDVKLVVVVMLDSGFDNGAFNNEAAFDNFFSGFQVDCLAIPFSDSKSRHYVCESLGFDPNLRYSREVPSLAVDPSSTVLQLNPFFLSTYGALSFPFSQEHFCNIDQQDRIIKLRFRSSDSPISLEQLLHCDNLSQISDENKSIRMSDLGNTPVGLYLYLDGAFKDKLQEIHKKCLDKGHKFEIIIVPLPFGRDYDPTSFYNLVKQSAFKDSRISSWWAYPFNEKICHSLWRLFDCCDEDQLLILPYADCFGDLCGKHVASCYGIDAYPFTRDAVVERKVSELRSLHLARLLEDNLMQNLYNKYVLLYFDYPTSCSDDNFVFETLDNNYREIKLKYPGTEVFYVPLKPVLDFENPFLLNMSWAILPSEMCESVIKHIFMNETYSDEYVAPTLVAFGEDGKILSRSAQKRLPISTASASLFDDTLRSEILSEMEEQL